MKKLVAQLNAQGDSLVAGTVTARHALHIHQDGILKNDGSSVFSGDVRMNGNLLVGQTIFVDNIVEYTTGFGVTVEGVLLQNGMVSATALQGVNVSPTVPVNGQVLGFNGANWIPTNVSGIVSLGGDVTGTAPSTTVVALRNIPVSSTAPSIAGQVLTYSGSLYQPGVVFPNGTLALGNEAVPNATSLNYATGVGYQALANAAAGGDGNTALGYQAGDTITTGNYNVIVGAYADVMANMNTFGVAVGYFARTNSNGVAIGNSANTNSVVNAISVGLNAFPTDAFHALALGINTSSVTGVPAGGAPAYLGVTINGVKYKITLVADP